MTRPTVVITDIEQRAALAATRALGRAGWDVVGVGAVPHAPARRSAYLTRFVRVPAPLSNPAGFAAALAEVAIAYPDACVLPVAEASHLAIYAHAPHLPQLLAPSAPGFQRAADKGLVMEVAAAQGIRVPVTYVIASRTAPLPLEAAAAGVLKPARSVPLEGTQREKRDVQYVTSIDELRRAVADTPDSAFPLLWQERVRGVGFGLSLIVWDAQLLGASAHRRLLEKPPSGGVSVLSESIAVPPSLLDRARRLLAALGFERGVAMLEFKGHTLEEAALMEINPRLWGSLQLAIDAGVNAPVLLAEASRQQQVAPPRLGQSGVRLRWFWGSVDHVVVRIRRRLDANGAPAPVGIARAWRETFTTVAREEVGRPGDRMPFVQESWNWLRRR